MAPNRKVVLTPPTGVTQLIASDGTMRQVVNGTIVIEYLYIENGLQGLLATGWTCAAAA